MATYNGATWIREQIESIRHQSVEDWLLLVSDDGSTDTTRDIILECSCADDRIKLLPARGGERGHVANFEYLLNEAKKLGSGYIFLCDQDDFWESEKIAQFLAAANNSTSGAMWYSDLQMLEERKLLESTYFEKMGFSHSVSTCHLLSQNSIPGCAMMLSRDLLEIALPFPEGLQNHDWWLALCASSISEAHYIDGSLIRYRMHSENTIGLGSPSRSLPKLPVLIARQRRVLSSKVTAVQHLLGQSVDLDDCAESRLQEWLSAFDGTSRYVAMKELIFGSFRPVSIPLLTLQLLAILSRPT